MRTYRGRFRQVREFRRYTQTKLADLVGAKQAAISQIESGKIQPSNDLLASIALATGFPIPFFSRPPGPSFPLGSLLFRAKRSVTKMDIAEAYRYGEIAFECAMVLRSELELIPVNVPDLTGKDPIEAARVVRASLSLPVDQPIPNVMYTFERYAGILIVGLPVLLPGRDAFSAWIVDGSRIPFIGISTGPPGDRIRFSVSHEFGHLVLHKIRHGNDKEIEREANQFASEFLMPEKVFRDEFIPPVTLQHLKRLKTKWGVSMRSLTMKAKELNVISSNRAQYLFRLLSKIGLDEPGELSVEKPRSFRRMAELIYGDPVNVDAFASDLDLPMKLIKDLVNVNATHSELVPTVPKTRKSHLKLVPPQQERS